MTMTKKNHHDPMERLKSDLAYWQRQLRLDHMDIKIRWFAEDEDNGDIGKMYPGDFAYQITLAIRDPSDLPKRNMKSFAHDPEVTLLHELLHVAAMPWANNKKVEEIMEDEVIQRHFEISLDATAEALVRARRGIIR